MRPQMPRHSSIKERIDQDIDSYPAGKTFECSKLANTIITGKRKISGRELSSILKGRLRWEENPDGDLVYEDGLWRKL